jgi:hypothetical protein
LATEEYRLRQTGQSQVYPGIGFAITAIKQARALDKKAENARELGLDYEPVAKPVEFFDWYDNAQWGNEDFKEGCHRSWNAAIKYTTPPAAQPAPVQVSPLEFVTMVMEREHLVGKPLFWAEWPNKENT